MGTSMSCCASEQSRCSTDCRANCAGLRSASAVGGPELARPTGWDEVEGEAIKDDDVEYTGFEEDRVEVVSDLRPRRPHGRPPATGCDPEVCAGVCAGEEGFDLDRDR
mmetsp:Transcript_52556/g.169572  ORF Transcript_52556/g.169572 Transcript_52556/m.169572 type:complete len:108 (-) Transcript_52556:1301-1624(-)